MINSGNELIEGTEPSNVVGIARYRGDKIDYIPHPAFTFGSRELPGIWVGKHQTTGTTMAPTILPNLTTLGNMTANQMFTTAQNFGGTNNITSGRTTMMRNIDWGAAVYLSHSRYGRNGALIAINYSSSFITGGANNRSTTGNAYRNI